MPENPVGRQLSKVAATSEASVPVFLCASIIVPTNTLRGTKLRLCLALDAAKSVVDRGYAPTSRLDTFQVYSNYIHVEAAHEAAESPKS